MINFDNFKNIRKVLDIWHNSYVFQKINFSSKTFEETISKDHPAYEDLVAFRNVMMTFSLSEIKAIYTDTFDFTKKHHYI